MPHGPHSHFHNHILVMFSHNSCTPGAMHRMEIVVQSNSPIEWLALNTDA